MPNRKIMAIYLGNCPESTWDSLDYLRTFQMTTLLPVGKDRLLGAGGINYV